MWFIPPKAVTIFRQEGFLGQGFDLIFNLSSQKVHRGKRTILGEPGVSCIGPLAYVVQFVLPARVKWVMVDKEGDDMSTDGLCLRLTDKQGVRRGKIIAYAQIIEEKPK